VKLDQASDDIGAALGELRERTGATSAVTVGFCFGGSLSFVSGANPDLELAAVAGLYGVLDASRFDGRGALAQARDIRAPVLGLFGGADQAIRADDVESFDEALDEAGVEHEIHVYPGAPHSFFDKKQDEFAEESEDAWRRILGFLAGLRERVA
jgi:carboxymethylenebutenolidase